MRQSTLVWLSHVKPSLVTQLLSRVRQPPVFGRGSYGSGMPESIPAGFCVFVGPKDCWILIESMVAGVWTGIGFSNLKKCWTRIRIQKFWNRSWVRVWKCDCGHIWPLGHMLPSSVVFNVFSTTSPLSNCPFASSPPFLLRFSLSISKLDGTLSSWKTLHVAEDARARAA